MSKYLVWCFYPVVLLLYAVYSFSQMTPNLVIWSNEHYWNFQLSMWQLGYHTRPLSTLIFTLLILLSFGAYVHILALVKKGTLSIKKLWVLFLICGGVLLPSYPALSNDIFNYLMNAKIMHEYGASPYTHSALDFPDDLWPHFMMNTHTTTPYGIVWTALGYGVYGLTFGDLQVGMLGFRLLALVAAVVVGWSIYRLSPPKLKLTATAFFLFNPLVFYEAINNTHNDIAMMAFLMGGVALSVSYKRTFFVSVLILLLGWILSVYTKLVTIIVPAVTVFYYGLRKYLPGLNVADLLVYALIVIMFADGSARFFPWYLLWSLSLAPLAKATTTKRVMWLFSLTGLLSYTIFLYTGTYSDELGFWRKIVFFSLPVTYLVLWASWQLKRKLVSLSY
jgi:hypothetical protein